MMRVRTSLLGVIAAAVTVLAACTPAASNLTQVKLQLQWEPQAQFAGFFAADREGF